MTPYPAFRHGPHLGIGSAIVNEAAARPQPTVRDSDKEPASNDHRRLNRETAIDRPPPPGFDAHRERRSGTGTVETHRDLRRRFIGDDDVFRLVVRATAPGILLGGGNGGVSSTRRLVRPALGALS